MKKIEQKFLLSLARKTLEIYLDQKEKLFLKSEEIPYPMLKENRGCFVTLEENGDLRGCIGHILPIQSLYKDVIENAVNAATLDPRFSPVTQKELKDITIEISVLSVPEILKYKNREDLLEKLDKTGVIIKKGLYEATFLPQVWGELPEKEEFLSHLCMKAGLSSDEWKKGTLAVSIYKAEVFKEETD